MNLPSTLPRPRTLALILLTLVGASWELSRAGSLTSILGHLYVGVSVITFTVAWAVTLVAGVIWVAEKVERGIEETKKDLLKTEQEKVWARR